MHLSRRSFIKSSGSAIAAASLPGFVLPGFSPSAGKKINIALCGLGVYASLLAEGLQETEYCRLAGIVTGTPSKAVDWKAKYSIPEKNIYNYENFDTIAGNKDIDAVYIVLPNSMHKEYAIRAAKANKHVMVEKPMALNATECREMIKACNTAGVQLAIGYRLHFEPYNMEMKRLGQAKIFGQVRLLEASLGYKVDNAGTNINDRNQWRMRKNMSGGGPLMNLGVYCLQFCRYTTGEEPVAVTAQFGPNTNPAFFSQVEASIFWQLQFPSGAVGNCSSTYNCNVDRVYASADRGNFELSPAISY